MAFTRDDRVWLKNKLGKINRCSSKEISETNTLLGQILTAVQGNKDYEVVCITNDGGGIVVKGIMTFPEQTIELNGVDVTDTYSVVKCESGSSGEGYTVYDEGCFLTENNRLIKIKGFQIRSFETNQITYNEYIINQSADDNYSVGTMLTDISVLNRTACIDC